MLTSSRTPLKKPGPSAMSMSLRIHRPKYSVEIARPMTIHYGGDPHLGNDVERQRRIGGRSRAEWYQTPACLGEQQPELFVATTAIRHTVFEVEVGIGTARLDVELPATTGIIRCSRGTTISGKTSS